MYKSWIKKSSKHQSLITDLKALSELKKDLERKFETLPEAFITSHELKRDFGYSGQGLMLAKKAGLLQPKFSTKKGPRYPVVEALKYYLGFPGLAQLEGTRINRRKKKPQNLLKELVTDSIKIKN